MRPVGILGGMGPEATILLMQKVLDAVPAQDDSDHVPLIVHQNTRVPSRLAALLVGQGDDPGPVLAQMAQDLQAIGAQALAMPCNTAHHYTSSITGASDLTFLNMLELTAADLSRTGATSIGILASPAVRQTGVLEGPFGRFGLKTVFPKNEPDKDPVYAIIKAIKSGKRGDAVQLTGEARALLDQGCDRVLVACTELSLLTKHLPDDIKWTDSLDCLTTAIVDFALGDQV